MATVKFYLKDTSTLNKPSLIYLYFRFSGSLLKVSTGEKIEPRKWNNRIQRPKKNYSGAVDLSYYLDKVSESAKSIHRRMISVGETPTVETVKEKLLHEIGRSSKVEDNGFFSCLERFMEVQKSKVSANYIKKVNTLKNHLMKFQTAKRFRITFKSVDLNFYDKFTTYLMEDIGHTDNTIGTNISTLKTFLTWASKRGHNSNFTYKDRDFSAPSRETDLIYLTESELMHLYEFDLSQKPRLEKVRDAFCFGCFTGLRFSDFSKIRQEQVKGDYVHIVLKKGKATNRIPLNSYAKEIIQKYDYNLPSISNQKTNSYLKELAKYVGINDDFILTRYRGGKPIEQVLPKHSLITSHTARRTFITVSLEKGMRPQTVMAITGHKTYKEFQKYIKITDNVKLKEMNEAWTKEPKLKAV